METLLNSRNKSLKSAIRIKVFTMATVMMRLVGLAINGGKINFPVTAKVEASTYKVVYLTSKPPRDSVVAGA